ncbi:copper resistance protein, partial [Klebsiella pneumoniae]|uniref:copper resistance protein n=1 Tax=Klebsiella pneumoniae TaxID=573 RepID=UPI00215D63D6
MNILITTTAFTALFCGAAFAQSSDIAHEAHRFVNNASAVSHVNSSTHENLPDRVNKNNTPSFSEMNEHERAIVAHSFMNNSASYAHQKMIEEHKKSKRTARTVLTGMCYSVGSVMRQGSSS